MSKTYIWYGKDEFSMDKIKPIDVELTKRLKFLKPKGGGVWASPTRTTMSWKKWCEEEMFALDKFKYKQRFKLSEDARILTITAPTEFIRFMDKYTEQRKYSSETFVKIKLKNDIQAYTYDKGKLKFDLLLDIAYHCNNLELNIEKLLADYDGMEVRHGQQYSLMHTLLDTWDCDSICVWNKDVINLI